MATLSEVQKKAVAAWAEEGCSLGEIQKRLKDEFDVGLTYMDMHMLMLDIDVKLKETEKKTTPPLATDENLLGGNDEAGPDTNELDAGVEDAGSDLAEDSPSQDPDAPAGEVKVTISDLVRPGAVANGTATFANGETADWYLDQLGRLGLNPTNPEFKPSQSEVMAFQQALQRAAREAGLG